MVAPSRSYVVVDGHPATVEELTSPLLLNFGHFTAFQVRGSRVRGWDLHLRRLDLATQELFGVRLDPEVVRAHLITALNDSPDGDAVTDAAVRIYVFPAINPGGSSDVTTLMVSVGPPGRMDPEPRRLQIASYIRPAPHLKHVGGFGQHYHLRRARRDGFTDALLVDQDGFVAETAICNIGFFEGSELTWPDGPSLHGITQQLLESTVPSRRTRVHRSDAVSMGAAFVCNSQGIASVSHIETHELPDGSDALAMLQRAYDGIPGQDI